MMDKEDAEANTVCNYDLVDTTFLSDFLKDSVRQNILCHYLMQRKHHKIKKDSPSVVPNFWFIIVFSIYF